jgi:proline iminopeptidase
VELAAIKVYDRWAGGMSKLIPKEEKHMIGAIRIEWHYHAHHLWLKELQYLEPEKLEKIKNTPCRIVDGRYDIICPTFAAWSLHKALPEIKLFIIPDAGHSAFVRSHSMLYLFLHTDYRYRNRVH